MQTCPVCGGWDQTQPVPAVVRSQTVFGSTAGSFVGVGIVPNGVIPVVAANRTVMTVATPLARMLTIPVSRRPSGMRFLGWVLTGLGAGLAVLLSIAVRRQEAHSVSTMWASIFAGLYVTAVLWLPGIVLTVAGHSRLRAYVREGRFVKWRGGCGRRPDTAYVMMSYSSRTAPTPLLGRPCQ